MINAVSLVLMKNDKILLLKREKNRIPIIVMKDDETSEKSLERWAKDNITVGTSKLIRVDKTFNIEGYNINLIFIDASNSDVNISNEDLILESFEVSNINRFEEELLRAVVMKCNSINYRTYSIEILERVYNIRNNYRIRKPLIELEKGRMQSNKAINLIPLTLILGAILSIFLFNYFGISIAIVTVLMTVIFFSVIGVRHKSYLGFFLVLSSIALSITYGIFTNEVFRALNFIVIPINLFSGFLLLTYDKLPFKFVAFITAFLEIIVGKSFENTGKLTFEFSEKFSKADGEKKSRNMKHIINGILISIPLVIVLLMILSGADEVFSYYLSNIWDYINIKNIYDFISRVFIATIIMFLTYGLYYSLGSVKVNNVNNKTFNRTLNSTTIITILVSIILIYLVFTQVQVTHLYLNKALPSGVSFSEYARKGFFQLVFLVVVNLIMIISIKIKTDVKHSKSNNVLNVLYSVIILLTINMGVAAIYKMNLYIGEFGYTRLRILVQAFTLFLCIALLLLLAFIWREKLLFKPIVVSAVSIYLVLNFVNIDNFIAKENLKLINTRAEIDLWYISTLSLDAKEAIDEGREKGLVNSAYYDYWANKRVETERWYEYNYFNNNILK